MLDYILTFYLATHTTKSIWLQPFMNTEDAALKFTGYVIDGFGRRKVTVATFLDVSNAFDCVNHKTLVVK